VTSSLIASNRWDLVANNTRRNGSACGCQSEDEQRLPRTSRRTLCISSQGLSIHAFEMTRMTSRYVAFLSNCAHFWVCSATARKARAICKRGTFLGLRLMLRKQPTALQYSLSNMRGHSDDSSRTVAYSSNRLMGANDEKKSVFELFQSGGCGVRPHRWNLFT